MKLIASLLKTDSALPWLAPTRIVIALLFTMPFDGRIPSFLCACVGAPHGPSHQQWILGSCQALLLIELVVGLSFMCGALVRLASPVAMIDFAIRGASNIGASIAPASNIFSAAIRLKGDWVNGIAYLAAITLVHELCLLGAGPWSLDGCVWRMLAHQGKAYSDL